ncbi:MAG: Hsp20/alpha crystallin family protein [Candidatus Thermoplasmatota archaeon]|jgi:HSP20 family protein|nr:Hsp20/alpha crystallin family protein [Candidatus Thermoplasmatota archaeon]
MQSKHPNPRPATVQTTRTTGLAEYLDRAFNELRNEMLTEFAPWGEHWSPGLEGRWITALTDVEDKGDSYEIRTNLPGVHKEDIEVKIQGHCLQLEAKQAAEREEKGRNYLTHERSYEGFFRSIDLPEDVLPEKVSAWYRDGVLVVSVPKSHPEPEKMIRVG